MQNNFNRSECMRLMQKICEAGMYVVDLNLYLDTHPDDEKALEMFHEACKQYKTCKEAFESCCYPLNSCGATCEEEWDWLCGVWPGERM